MRLQLLHRSPDILSVHHSHSILPALHRLPGSRNSCYPAMCRQELSLLASYQQKFTLLIRLSGWFRLPKRACSTSETPEKRWSGCLTRRFARFACHTRWHGGGCAEAKWLIGQRWHSNAAYSFSYSTSSGAYPAVLRRHQQAGLPRCLQLVGDRPAASNPNL